MNTIFTNDTRPIESAGNLTTGQLLQLVNSLVVVVFTLDREGRFGFVNKASGPVLGYAPEQLTGQSIFNYVVTEYQCKSRHYLHQLMSGVPVASVENYMLRADGSEVPIVWRAQWDSNEEVLYCVARDISDRVEKERLHARFEEKIKRQHRELSEILERMDDGFFAMDREWRISYINPPVEAMLNIRREDYLTRNFWECFPAMVGSVYYQQYHKAMTANEPVHFEEYFQPFDKWLSVDAYPMETGLSVFFRDVTGDRKTKEEMDKLSLIIKKTNNLVMLAGPAGEIRWVNDAFVQKTGFTLAEAQGRRLTDIMGGQETDCEAVQRIRQQYGAGNPFKEELLYYTKQKEELLLEISGQSICDEEGRVKEVFCIMVDITERKRLQQRLDRERELHQQKMTAAVINAQEGERSEIGKELHDNVNQLLTTVKLYLGIGLSTPGMGEDLTRRSIDLLQESIDEIRNLSKRLSAPTVEPLGLGESVTELCERVAKAGRFTVVVDTEEVNSLEVSEELHLAIYRITQEHFTNILKHAGASRVQVFFFVEEGKLILKVIDNGKGFNPREKSTGIGINNMTSRAQSTGGSLILNSAPGIGCVLIAYFPLEEKEPM
jgi:PAS domain S-box-containing protein